MTQPPATDTAPGTGGPAGGWNAPGAGGQQAYPAHADAPTASVPVVQPDLATPQSGTPQSATPQSAAPRAGAAAASAAATGTAAAGGTRAARSRGPRRARLQLRHIDPWTVLKFSCVLAIALFFVWLIVVGVLFGVLDGAGVIDKINSTVTTINGGNAKPPVTAGVVFGGAAIIGVVNIVLFIALTTIGSVVYNLCADLVGGIEVTLSER